MLVDISLDFIAGRYLRKSSLVPQTELRRGHVPIDAGYRSTPMEIAQTKAQIIEAVRGLPGRIGLAATMGALHAGHVAVIRAAKAESDSLIASLFVNPAQFGGATDFDDYPRRFDRDMEVFEKEGVDVVWAPSLDDVYPEGFGTYIDPGSIARPLEGAFRPRHFRGVATIVAKLFTLLRPDVSVFGQKDWQQTQVVAALVGDLDFDIKVLVVPTVRDEQGLALSSRNRRLSGDARRAARVLYKGLKLAADDYAAGETDAAKLRRRMLTIMAKERRCRPEYASVAHAFTLEELELAAEPMVLSCAAYVDSVRLIDNVVIGVELYGGNRAV